MPKTDPDKRKSGGLQVAEPPAPPPFPTPSPRASTRSATSCSAARCARSRPGSRASRSASAQEHETLRADFARQIESLDAFIRSEVQVLTERLAAERTKRTEELKSLAAEIKEAIRALERRHVKLEEAANMADAALRDQLLAQSASARRAGEAGERLTAELSRSHQELDSAKTDSTALAALLTDMAARLGGAGRRRPPGKNGPRS